METHFDSLPVDILLHLFNYMNEKDCITFSLSGVSDRFSCLCGERSYCRKCVDLHLEIVYSEEYFRYGPFGKDDYDDVFVNRAREKFFPNLSWMALLKNLVILKRGGLISYPDECVKGLVNWIFSQYDMSCVERVWIMEDVGISRDTIPSGSQIKSILCDGQLSSFDSDDDGRFGQLEHIGGIGLEQWTVLPNLRYIHGYCISSEGVDELCRAHPKLEHLHLNDNNGYPFCMKDDWMLNHLKTLVYNCSFPRKDILELFLKATPNLEALHIGYSNRSAMDPWTPLGYKSSQSGMTDCLKTILRCGRLTTLSLNAFCLFEGDFFETIFSGCPLLRNLHICGGLSCDESFDNLCRYLPLAEKLRDFRLQYAYEYEGEIMPNRAVLNTLLDCKRLERIVLYEEDGPNIPWKSQELQDVLLKFVSSMPNLVCFCFITASEIEPGTVAELKKKFDELIVPIRPAFWYHVDQSLPRATDPTVPRIHYDQIVSPINYLEMSPEF
ncbi:uncharacterized protein LOC124193876 isoform X3 [Daphnia pulex]|uniref:uncharacterized protein LOC124193876 isoform X3 n=1 Tax=Daphnia pulex TaxID=6669 RepID=UPI001EE0672C|nr:uncharacterized protein LOC124193876 isoform X3 [Daphnia pulex]